MSVICLVKKFSQKYSKYVKKKISFKQHDSLNKFWSSNTVIKTCKICLDVSIWGFNSKQSFLAKILLKFVKNRIHSFVIATGQNT